MIELRDVQPIPFVNLSEHGFDIQEALGLLVFAIFVLLGAAAQVVIECAAAELINRAADLRGSDEATSVLVV